jgi:hypothetical protein
MFIHSYFAQQRHRDLITAAETARLARRRHPVRPRLRHAKHRRAVCVSRCPGVRVDHLAAQAGWPYLWPAASQLVRAAWPLNRARRSAGA